MYNGVRNIYKEIKKDIILSDVAKIITLEMSKLKDKPVKEMTEIERWLNYLKYVGEAGREKIIEEIVRESEAISMTNKILYEVSEDERIRAEAISREHFKLEMDTMLYESRKEGREEGREEGIYGTISVMKKLGFDKQSIVRELKDTYNLENEKAVYYYESYELQHA